MTQEHADVDNVENGEGGASSGGSSNGGSDNDDKPITAKQLKAALASQRAHYEGQLEAQAREFEAFKSGAASRKDDDRQAPKRFTRAELKAAVDAGQITQEQADDRWASQVREEAIEHANATANAAVDARTKKERIDADISAYKRLKPEIMESGSETRKKVQEEFNYLTSIGQPKSVETELAAIRSVLGPLDKLQKAANSRRVEDHDEQGGSSGDSGGGKPTGKKLVDALKGEHKDFYQRGIKSGRYKDWEDVEKELSYASPNVRRRLGLPA